MSVEKEMLRNYLREIRGALPIDERNTMSCRITDHLKTVILPDEVVLVYCSKDPEVDTRLLIDYLLDQKIGVIVPIIQKEDRTLRFSYLLSCSDLICSTFQVPEPIGKEIPAEPREITTAIIPMLGFDRSGGRLGYGAGYYDRFLAAYPDIRKIGIAYGCQEMAGIPLEYQDIRMDLIITEEGVVFPSKG